MGLRNVLRSHPVSALLERKGFHLTALTPAERLRAVIAMLHPRDAGVDLVRIGGDGDGGYLVPDRLDGIAACFSPGVSTVATFELTLARDHGIPCHLIDASVDGPPETHPRITFEKKFLGHATSGDTVRLADWVQDMVGPDEGELLLQMDIEGAEYDVLLDAPAGLLARFRIIVVELHGLDDMFAEPCLRFYGQAFDRLTRNHTVVHLHPNNAGRETVRNGVTIPSTIEVTLLRNDHVRGTAPAGPFPHPLDAPNRPGRPDRVLPADWYTH